MDKPGKLIPVPTEETQPFWDGCAKGALRIQRCIACGHRQFPPGPVCVTCLNDDLEWITAAGRGTVASYTVVRWSPNPAYAADAPYVLALIALEEGPRMLTNIVGSPPDAVRIGAAVAVSFEQCAPGIALPKFRLVR
jgi:uncharacterized protein